MNAHFNYADTVNDTSLAHRLRLRRGASADEAPSVLAKFVRCSVRDQVYKSLFALKDFNANKPTVKRIFINEDLVEVHQRLLGAARKLTCDKKLKSSWSHNCRLYISCVDDSTHAVNDNDRLMLLVNDPR